MIQINQEINNQNNKRAASENLQNYENKQSLRAQRYQMQEKNNKTRASQKQGTAMKFKHGDKAKTHPT